MKARKERKMELSHIQSQANAFLNNNSTTILTSVGVTGTVATAVLTGKATLKCSHILDDSVGEFTTKEKFQACWQEYIPACGVGTLTISSIVLANRLSSRKAAALAAAYGISEKAFAEYKDKVVEKLGENKERKVRDEIAQDRVSNAPVSKEVIITDGGEVLCFDIFSGRYFKSTVENIKQGANKVNEDIINHMYASLSSFYDALDIPPNGVSDNVGWKSDNLIEIQFSTVMSPDNRPCVAIDFVDPPVADYTQLY